MRAVWTLVAAAAVGLAVPSPGAAATFKVNCAKKSLQTRIDAVPARSVLLVKGTCGPVTIAKSITIDGNPTATISGKGVGRAIEITGTPTVRLVDLRITGGKVSALPTANGGGISHAGGLLVLRRTVVTGNVAEADVATGALAQGGGIYSTGGTVQLYRSAIRKNVARGNAGTGASGYGGGILHKGNLLLDHSTVAGNRARADASASSGALAGGGGIYVTNGKVTIRSSHVDSNVASASGSGAATYAQGYGAGITVSGGTRFTLTGSTVRENQSLADLVGGISTAQSGGLEMSTTPNVSVRNTVFARNTVRATSPASATANAYGAAAHINESAPVSFVKSRITGGRVVATSGGTASGSGAGLSLSAVPATLRTTLVASNTIDATGGSGAASAEGGALVLRNASSLQLVQSTVRANRADSAGPGIAVSNGGGIASIGSTIFVRSSTLNANVAGTTGQALGGGLYVSAGGPHELVNSTLAGNRVNGNTARGGGIDVDTSLILTASTVARNSAKLGGGLYVESGTTVLRGSLLGLNSASMSGPDCSQSVVSAEWNLISTTLGCTFAATGADKTGLAPKLGLLKANGGPTQTIALLAGSPAVNAIPKTKCLAGRDQRGVKRPKPKNGRCDIGAYEKKP